MLVEQSSRATNPPFLILRYVGDEYTPTAHTSLMESDQKTSGPSLVDVDAETVVVRGFLDQANPL
jgi:hypothetical protein